MRPSPPDDELDLPPLDGEGEELESTPDDDEIDEPEGASGLDDATGEDDPVEDIAVEGAEAGWLVDAEESATLDVGTIEFAVFAETKLSEEDEPEGGFDELAILDDDESVVDDVGEEGPLAEDEELREEDLPALDADEDGDVDDEDLYDHAALAAEEELRWDDRAWARLDEVLAADGDVRDDSGMLAAPGDDPAHGLRDATWKRLDESGNVTAAALVPGESVVVAMDARDRAVLVRILPDGTARIIAEIEPGAARGDDEDDGEACRVTALRWDAANGCVVASGSFGTQAFRPA